jgi:hypothetical protein
MAKFQTPGLNRERRVGIDAPNMALQRTRSAPLRSPLSLKTLGAAVKSPVRAFG